MNTLKLKSGTTWTYMLLASLLILWALLQHHLVFADERIGMLDPNIWLLILLSLLCFLLVCGLCWTILQHCWAVLGLPRLTTMVLQFKTMETWQQLSFYLCSFCSLLLAAVGVLAAIL